MSDIRSIRLRNFQSHVDSKLEPAPAGGLTVITGPTDSGKSAIIRGMKWALYNQPQGDDFRRVGCDFVEVALVTDHGTVTRRRAATVNRYIVNGQPLEGFGRDVPLEVQEVTGVRPVRLGDQVILANLAGQLDAPFLGSSISGPVRARILGLLAGTEVIDRAARDLGTDIYRDRQEAKRLESEVASLRQQVTQYDHLPRLAAAIARLRELAAEVQASQDRLQALRAVRGRLAVIQTRKAEAARELANLGDIDGADALAGVITGYYEFHQKLAAIRDQLRRITGEISVQQTLLSGLGGTEQSASALESSEAAIIRRNQLVPLQTRLSHVRAERERWQAALAKVAHVDAADEHVAAVTATVAQFYQIQRQRDALLRIRYSIQQAEREFATAQMTMQQAQETYTNTLRELGRCPVCGGSVDDNHVQEVLSA